MSFQKNNAKFDEKTMTLEFEIDVSDLECPNADSENAKFCSCDVCTADAWGTASYSLPASYEVCHKCDGKGTHVNPAVDGHGISREEFDEDPEFREAYMSGVYDITCQHCEGLRVIPVINEEKLTDEQKKIYEIVENRARENAQYDRMCQMERDFGA